MNAARRLAIATAIFVGTVALAAPAPGSAVRFDAVALPASLRYAAGAPAGFSGGFGEESCHACHFEAEVNAAPGSVTIAGVPDRFAPGEEYRLTVTLTRPGMTASGFQLTARFENDGAQAGALAPAPGEETRVAVETQEGVQYINQRDAGTALTAPDTARWTLLWTAPAASGAVRFHVAANAADGDETVYGDYVHTAVVDVAP